MAHYPCCPNPKCRRSKSSTGRNDMKVSRCQSCGFEGCWNGSGLASVGCWTSPACPNCGQRGTAVEIGWLT